MGRNVSFPERRVPEGSSTSRLNAEIPQCLHLVGTVPDRCPKEYSWLAQRQRSRTVFGNSTGTPAVLVSFSPATQIHDLLLSNPCEFSFNRSTVHNVPTGKKKNKPRGFSPLANYKGRVTAA
jgi:hypothetical protein